MIKTILWDFDGVILDSMKIKGDGFRELFKEYDEKYLEMIEKYHYANGGVSRFDKIRYFYNDILQENITDDKVLKLATKFATIINKKIFDKSSLIDETVEFIKENYEKYNFHIVSGAEHDELNDLCRYFELDKYFLSIEGSPTKKDILIENILSGFNYNKNEVVLIGDSITDYNAAKENGIDFYGFNNNELKELGYYIESFKDFSL